MLIITKVSELLEVVEKWKRTGVKSGLVPTMGALHDGHLSLVDRSIADNDVTMVSVFVNPIQFNNPEDLKTYPRREEEDFKLLARKKVDLVFAPTVEEIYPEGKEKATQRTFDLGKVAEILEGFHRPGHFQGVANVVWRLFSLCRPTRAYFGMKDFQQIIVVRNMVRSEGLDVQIVPCPIKRADDGLALSSRNLLLSEEQRKLAPEIHKALTESLKWVGKMSVEEVVKSVEEKLNSLPEMKVESFDIVDAETLCNIENWDESRYIVGLITVYVGKVRLIDNIFYKGEEDYKQK